MIFQDRAEAGEMLAKAPMKCSMRPEIRSSPSVRSMKRDGSTVQNMPARPARLIVICKLRPPPNSRRSASAALNTPLNDRRSTRRDEW